MGKGHPELTRTGILITRDHLDRVRDTDTPPEQKRRRLWMAAKTIESPLLERAKTDVRRQLAPESARAVKQTLVAADQTLDRAIGGLELEPGDEFKGVCDLAALAADFHACRVLNSSMQLGIELKSTAARFKQLGDTVKGVLVKAKADEALYASLATEGRPWSMQVKPKLLAWQLRVLVKLCDIDFGDDSNGVMRTLGKSFFKLIN